MYTGFKLKRARKQSRIEVLEAEVKKLQKLLGTMVHLHERLKNERIKGSEAAKLPTLPNDVQHGSERIEATLSDLPQGSSGEPTPGKD